ncbi:MAG: ABC transporter ATP-binding protein [Kiritimatiellia bacterium]|jgi:multiple sugar transport system ATP-binding protein
MAKVVLNHVTKIYANGFKAVDDISLDIHDREFVVLVGPSGCGKSTTLRMIAGLETISGGTIEIGGRVVNDVPARDREIAMVFQNYALYPHMTVRENLSFALKLRRTPRAEIARRVAETAAMLGIDPLLDRRPKQLSGGQRQRVALGRAIVRQPSVFLFDEPLSNLDAKMRVQMRVEISRLHKKLDSTMIYVTHDQTEAMTMGDRIVVMDGGRIQQAGEPMEVYRHPANRFAAGFVGTPSMNFFPVATRRDAAGDPALRFAGATIPCPDAWKPILDPLADAPAALTLGVRPEDVLCGTVEDGIPTEIDVIEPMGAETYLYAALGDTPFVARIPGQVPYSHAQVIPVAFRMSEAHLFDSEGKTIT